MPRRHASRQFRITLDGKFCVYCGELASVGDHFPPFSLGLGGYLLPACAECNAIAGTEHPLDFEARADYVKQTLRRRYHRMLQMPDWGSSEVALLGYNMKAKVNGWRDAKPIAQQRIAWDAATYLRCIDPGNDFAAFAVGTSGTPTSVVISSVALSSC